MILYTLPAGQSPASHRAAKPQRTALNRRALPHIGRRSRRARRSTAGACLTSGGEAAAHGAQPPPSPASHRAAKPQRTALNRRRALPHIGRRSRSARRSTAAEPCLTSGGEAAAHGAQPPPSPTSHRAAKPQRTALNRRRALPHIGRRRPEERRVG